MDKYISTLRRELTSINVVQAKLGLFDYGTEKDKQLVPSQQQSSLEAWSHRPTKNIGSQLRVLQNDVFDVIVRSKARNSTVFVGSGSRLYSLVGFLPLGFLRWLVTMREVRETSLSRTAGYD